MSFLSNLIDPLRGVNINLGTREDFIDNVASYVNGGANSYKSSDPISTVYTCIRILADSVSRLPINVMSFNERGDRVPDKQYGLYPILHYNPNPYTTSQKFFNTLEHWRNLKGNAFARIERVNGRPVALYLVPPSHVVGYTIIDNQVYYKLSYNEDGKEIKETINAQDMLHFTGTLIDGIWGINPIEKLKMNLSTTWKGMKTIDSFYANNATTSKIVKYPTYAPNQKALKQGIEDFKNEFAGPANAGKLLTAPAGTDIVDMQMNVVDAAILETVKYNDAKIANLYGVPANYVVETATKFNNVEYNQIDFKVNTMAAILRMYRQELELKLLPTKDRLAGTSIEFNTNSLVETDMKSRIEALTKEINWGMISPNDANKIEGLPTYDGGALHWSPLNMGFTEVRVKQEEQLLNDPTIRELIIKDPAFRKAFIERNKPSINGEDLISILNKYKNNDI